MQVQINQIESLADLVSLGGKRFFDKTALQDKSQTFTYGQLAEIVSRVSLGLESWGIREGDRCCLILPNCVEFVLAHFAILSAGGVSVPIDPSFNGKTAGVIISDAQPSLVITNKSIYSRLDITNLVPENVKIVCVDDEKSEPSWQMFLQSSSASKRTIASTQDSLAVILYTTGSTGIPKGVMLSHRNTLCAIQNIVGFVGYTENDREVVTLPLSHSFGLGHVYCNLAVGGAVYLENGLANVGRVLKAIRSFAATGFPGTPLSYSILLDRYGEVFRDYGQNLRFAVINTSPMPPQLTERLQTLLPNLNILVYYGLTEASRSTFISLSDMGPTCYRSVGKAVGDVRIRIADEQGNNVAHGIEGEVLISGDHIAGKYWRSEKPIQVSGELKTGDTGRLDSEGNLFLSGRLKDLINVDGVKVSPKEVEDVLTQHPSVQDAAVVGCADLPGRIGESICAAIVYDSSEDAPDLHGHCQDSLEKVKIPTVFVAVEQIPRSGSGESPSSRSGKVDHGAFELLKIRLPLQRMVSAGEVFFWPWFFRRSSRT